LAVMLVGVWEEGRGAGEMVGRFLGVYGRWVWARDVVALPDPANTAPYPRTPREPLVVLGIERPRVNHVGNASACTVGAFERVLRAGWDGDGGGDGERGVVGWVGRWSWFVRVRIGYWGRGCVRGRAFVGWLESRFVGVRGFFLLFSLWRQLNVSAHTASGADTCPCAWDPCAPLAGAFDGGGWGRGRGDDGGVLPHWA
jgi:hypothetical protein